MMLFCWETGCVSMPPNAKFGRRQRECYSNAFSGKKVCPPELNYIHNIGEDYLYVLQRHYQQNGVQPRVHGNSRSRPKDA